MQTVAEIDEMLSNWEQAFPRLTPKTRKVRKTKPAWHDKLNEMEDYRPPPLAGVLVSCGCPCRMRISAGHFQGGKGGGRVVNNLERKCFVCGTFRSPVLEGVPS